MLNSRPLRSWSFLAAFLLVPAVAIASAGNSEPNSQISIGKAGRIRVGEPAPAFGVARLLQAPVEGALVDTALRGYVVVLDFWATWCAPCVVTIPHLNELAAKFEGRPVRFIAITEEEESVVRGFLEQQSMRSWIGLDADGSIVKAYGIPELMPMPATYVIDKVGRIAAITVPTGVTEALLEDLLAERSLPPQALYEVRIRPSVAAVHRSRGALGQLTAERVSLKWLISVAYGVPGLQIVDDAGLDDGLYDVVVATPRGRKSVETTLRTALEATFDFTTRREVREVDAYELRLAHPDPFRLGPRVKPTQAAPGDPSTSSRTKNEIARVNSGIGSVASSLELLLGRPVSHEIELADSFDWSLTFDDTEPKTIQAAVREQLGLDLAPTRRTVEYLVIESSRP